MVLRDTPFKVRIWKIKNFFFSLYCLVWWRREEDEDWWCFFLYFYILLMLFPTDFLPPLSPCFCIPSNISIAFSHWFPFSVDLMSESQIHLYICIYIISLSLSRPLVWLVIGWLVGWLIPGSHFLDSRHTWRVPCNCTISRYSSFRTFHSR